MNRIARAIAALLLLMCLSDATAGTPRLSRLIPPGGQRGTTVDVQFTGRFLANPQEVMFYEPGITAESFELVEGEVGSLGRRERVERETRVRVRLKIAADCPLGPVGLRLRTSSGLTDYQRFFVGPFPQIDENEPNQPAQQRNDRRESAKSVPANSTVYGRLNDPADVDWYSVEARAGERVSAELEAARLGVERGLPDLHLTILDGSGKTLAAADDSSLYLQDPCISVVAPSDGTYFVGVRHSIFNGANDVYRVHVGTFPRPTGIYPAGGQAGQELSVQFLGDPRGAWNQSIQLPSAGPSDVRLVPTDGDLQAPSPFKVRVSPFPNVLEKEPNETPEEAVDTAGASLPLALNGIIEKPGDVDCFRFEAKKGDRFRIIALANALGSRLDPTITITPPQGKPLKATDSRLNQLGLPPSGGMNRDLLDPVLDLNVPEDGPYVLAIEDDRGNGGADYVYRIEFQPEADAALTYVPLEPENQFTPQARQTINVPSGGQYNTSISVFYTNRPFDGDLRLEAIGLPDGVTMHAPPITAAMTRVPVVFEAAANTRLQGCFVDIVARPANDKDQPAPASGFRQTVAMNSYGNNDYYLHTHLDRLPLAVTEPAPFSIEVDPPKSALVQNGEMPLKFSIRRASGFEGPVTVSMEWRPNGVNVATPTLVRPEQSDGEYLLSAARNATAGTYQVTLTAVSGGERPGYYDNANRTYVATRPFTLTVAEPHVEARLARTSIERGKTAQLVVKLSPLRPFQGTGKATLARLPRGVELVGPERQVTADDTEVRFELRATSEALVGNYQGITLDLTVSEDGQTVRQLCGYGLLRIDSERGGSSARTP